MFKQFFVFLLIIACKILHGLAEECEITEETKPVQKEKRLREDLLCNYNKHFIPLHNRSEIMSVAMAMEIIEYTIFDMSPKKLHLQSEITVKWSDVFLIWNPEEYDSITELVMNTDEIWSPEIMPEELDFFARSDSILASTECKVTSSGNVSCTVTSSHSGFCRTDATRWPFDEHVCELQYMSWSFNGEKLLIEHPENDTLTVRASARDRGWVMIGRKSDYSYGRPQMSLMISEMYFEFTLMRNVTNGWSLQFYFISVFAMTSLSLMCFWTNFEGTERLILCLINIIHNTFLLQDMEYKLPRLGHSVPYLLRVYRDSLVIALVILIESMVFKNILTSDKPTPSWLVAFDRTVGRPVIRKILMVDGVNGGEPKKTGQESYEDELEYIKQSHQMEKRRTIQIIDRIFFIAILVTYFIMITILLNF